MNVFEMRILNSALSQVDSDDDAFTLAATVIKLTKEAHSNHVLEYADTQLLTLLINHERKTSESPSFSNIHSLLAKRNLGRLARIPGWRQFAAHRSGRLQESCLLFMEKRLSPFRLLQAA